YMRDPQQITVEHKQLTVDSLEQRYYLVNENEKMAALTRLFEIEPVSSALIFARTRVGTGELANELTVRGFPAEALSGDLSQDARIRVLNRFRQNQIKVLVATDVAARGLDIDDISHVFNYDLPPDPEVYVHRVGRTGRVGKTGIAISLVTPRENNRLRRIEALTRQAITQSRLPTAEEIHQYRENQLLEQVMMWLRRGRCKQEREIVEKLVENGYDSIDIASVALKMARSEEKQRPIEEITEVRTERPRRNWQERDRSNGANGHSRRNDHRRQSSSGHRNGRDHKNNSHEKGMVRLALSRGKQHGIRPNDVVGTIAFHGNIPGNTIGKILIGDDRTLVDVPEASVAQVMAKSGAFQIHKQTISIELA
ncbi:MAG: DEAD/DEAH box helicase, partial [Anaerolineales bacterium]|nr:DEAD/DEAH box helicase [Anaerolineales bacterium]